MDGSPPDESPANRTTRGTTQTANLEERGALSNGALINAVLTE